MDICYLYIKLMNGIIVKIIFYPCFFFFLINILLTIQNIVLLCDVQSSIFILFLTHELLYFQISKFPLEMFRATWVCFWEFVLSCLIFWIFWSTNLFDFLVVAFQKCYFNINLILLLHFNLIFNCLIPKRRMILYFSCSISFPFRQVRILINTHHIYSYIKISFLLMSCICENKSLLSPFGTPKMITLSGTVIQKY